MRCSYPYADYRIGRTVGVESIQLSGGRDGIPERCSDAPSTTLLPLLLVLSLLVVAMASPAAAKVDRKVFISESPIDMTVALCNGGEDVRISGTEHWEY
jgi:hypothetical protein